jgi:hypothetical protein
LRRGPFADSKTAGAARQSGVARRSQVVRGFALMFLFIPINAVALGTLPPARLKNASGLYNLMRNLGGAIGLAGINTIINDRFALHWARLVAKVQPQYRIPALQCASLRIPHRRIER